MKRLQPGNRLLLSGHGGFYEQTAAYADADYSEDQCF
jgi:hypothetical protein